MIQSLVSRDRREKPCQIGVEEDCNLRSGDNGMLCPSGGEELFSRETTDVAGVPTRGSFKQGGSKAGLHFTSLAMERRSDVIAHAPCRLTDTPLQISAGAVSPVDWFCARPSRWFVSAGAF